MIKNRFYADNGVDYATQQCLEGFGTLDLPQEIAGYKPRPLEGVWATAPFLHNGSVPTLYQMLLPPAKRDAKFFVGRREYDPVHVGFVTKPDDDGDDDGFWLDTSIPGNHNTGHAFAADAATWSKHLDGSRRRIRCRDGVIGPEFTDESASTSSSTSRSIAICRRRPPTISHRNAGCAERSCERFAASAAADNNYTRDFAAVEQAESDWIRERRPPRVSVPPDAPLVGLALSGGGIRSAAFNMGVLQTLARSGLLAARRLSIVGVRRRLHRFLPHLAAGARAGSSRPTTWARCRSPTARGTVLDWLRAHGRYLITGKGLSGWTLGASILSGTLLNLFVLLPRDAAADRARAPATGSNSRWPPHLTMPGAGAGARTRRLHAHRASPASALLALYLLATLVVRAEHGVAAVAPAERRAMYLRQRLGELLARRLHRHRHRTACQCSRASRRRHRGLPAR